MDDRRRPISWVVEYGSVTEGEEIEQWAWDNNVDFDKLVPRGSTFDVFDPAFKPIYRARLTSWNKNTVLLGKLTWGGTAE
jgi:hypothetical protein